ncbi:unannotated protein [freshwater metagenome]|uniref:Unannotated protein n=1 Tax=freshwater metagenome TaxID=449393 RepID=A0A6J6G3F1_9ZZZZ
MVLPTESVSTWVSVAPTESVTWKVSDTGLPVAAVGVPEMTPVPEFNDRPAGKDPAVRVNVYGATPPEAASVVEYATLRAASGKLALVRSNVDVAGATTLNHIDEKVSEPPCRVMVPPVVLANVTAATTSHSPGDSVSEIEHVCPEESMPMLSFTHVAGYESVWVPLLKRRRTEMGLSV